MTVSNPGSRSDFLFHFWAEPLNCDFPMNRKPIDSKMARSIGYSEVASVLEIEFQSGEIWQYHNVPEKIYLEMLDGKLGKLFHEKVRGKFLEFRVHEG